LAALVAEFDPGLPGILALRAFLFQFFATIKTEIGTLFILISIVLWNRFCG
jgi:hypothetical protein